ncbi:MAG: amino acid ABC transporter ATP-binding protein, partial [Pseudonocardia sp.]|nr:amino acid ABC transporter ATP-binding protein [Pseudonocardia sp.]
HNVSKAFRGTTVLDGLDLSIHQGEKLALIGPSGSGKTTILRILMTLVRPDGGAVLIDGEELWRAPRDGRMVPAGPKHLRRMRSQIGMVFQQFNLFPHMTAWENISEALVQVQRRSVKEARDISRQLLDRVGLSAHAEAYPWQMSGGQQQRVAIARAIALKPKILLCDEVTSALDPELVGEVQEVLRDLVAGDDVTVLLVTHEMRFAHRISDRVMMFDGGSVVEEGAPGQVLDAPRHERTKKFLQALLAAS